MQNVLLDACRSALRQEDSNLFKAKKPHQMQTGPLGRQYVKQIG